MIDLENESVFPLTDAPKKVPQRGRHPMHIGTGYRWAQRGLRGIKLETLQIGGAKFTSAEALQRFFERLTSLDSGEPKTRTVKARASQSAKANTELAAAGW